jgi:hypothetical protein
MLVFSDESGDSGMQGNAAYKSRRRIYLAAPIT